MMTTKIAERAELTAQVGLRALLHRTGDSLMFAVPSLAASTSRTR